MSLFTTRMVGVPPVQGPGGSGEKTLWCSSPRNHLNRPKLVRCSTKLDRCSTGGSNHVLSKDQDNKIQSFLVRSKRDLVQTPQQKQVKNTTKPPDPDRNNKSKNMTEAPPSFSKCAIPYESVRLYKLMKMSLFTACRVGKTSGPLSSW